MTYLVDIPGRLVRFFVCLFLKNGGGDLGKKECVLGERAQGGMEKANCD